MMDVASFGIGMLLGGGLVQLGITLGRSQERQRWTREATERLQDIEALLRSEASERARRALQRGDPGGNGR